MGVKLDSSTENALQDIPIEGIVQILGTLRETLGATQAEATAAWTAWRNCSNATEILTAKINYLKKRLQDEL